MKKFPELVKLQEEFRASTLLDYLNNHLLKEREFLPLDGESYEVFFRNFKGKAVRQISTGSHMGFLQWDFPLCLGENILVNLNALLHECEPVVTVPFSRITFKNSSRPGVIDLSGMGRGSVHLPKYIIRGRSKITTNKAPPVNGKEVDNFLHEFTKLQKNAPLFPFVDQPKLKVFIDLVRQVVDKGGTFNEQGSWLSSQLWPHLFRDIKTKPLVITPMEDLRLKRENLLENKRMRELLEKHFAGAYGALSSTYFYYGSCRCGIEFPLKKVEKNSSVFLEGNCLDKNCVHYGKEKYSVEVNDILDEVENKNLNESLFISFYNVWALTGVDVMGGFNQIHYLKEFKEKLADVFKKLGDTKRSGIITKRATNLLDLGVFVAFNPKGGAKSGSQVFLEGGLDNEYLTHFSRLPFAKTIDVSLEIISSIFGKKPDYERVLQLLKENKMEFMVA